MRAATPATAARVAAAGNGIAAAKRQFAYTVLNEQRITAANQLTRESGTGTPVTASTPYTVTTVAPVTDPVPAGQSSYVHVDDNGYNGTSYSISFTGPWDFTNAFLRLHLRMQHYSISRGYTVRFATTAAAYAAGNYLSYATPTPSWLIPSIFCWDSVDPALMTVVGSGANLASIGYIGFTTANANQTDTCFWDFARIQCVQKAGTKAKLVIWHDDSVLTGFNGLKPRLDLYGWGGSEAHEAETVDQNAGQLASSDIAAAKLSAWSFGTHAINAPGHVSVLPSAFVNQMTRSKVQAAKYGNADDASDFAYWGFLDFTTSYPQVQRLFRTGRNFINGLQAPDTQPPGDPHSMKALGTTDSDTFTNTWKPLLLNAIAAKGIAQIVFHQNVGAAASANATEFEAMLAWLDTQRANIDVVSIARAIAPLLVGATGAIAAPTSPLTLTATAGDGQIKVARTGGFGEGTAVKLYRGTTATGTPIATALPFTDTGLTNGTAVSYIATVVNSAGTVTSAVVSATPATPPPAGTAADNFNRADSTTSLGVASDNGTWTILAGTWGISTNRAYNASGTSGAMAVRDLGSANHYVEGMFTSGIYQLLVARVADANNWYGVQMGSGGALALYKFVGGTATNIGSPGTVTATDVVRLVVSGSTISVNKNGTQIFTKTDTAITAGTKVGMRADNATGLFDNLAAATV